MLYSHIYYILFPLEITCFIDYFFNDSLVLPLTYIIDFSLVLKTNLFSLFELDSLIVVDAFCCTNLTYTGLIIQFYFTYF